MFVTEGHLLGGRVRYNQTRDGFRTGIEPIMLAAAIPARAGDHVLEGGSGAGAALLCLISRVPGISGVGVEHDADQAHLAAENAVANGYHTLQFVAGDIETAELPNLFEHACANPPYHHPGGTRSPNHERERAKRAADGLLSRWAAALGGRLRSRGTLTFILPASLLPLCLSALEACGCSGTAILPLWPTTGRPCKLLLVRGVKGGRAPLRLLAGLTLHRQDGGFTAAAEAILRGGAALSMD